MTGAELLLTVGILTTFFWIGTLFNPPPPKPPKPLDEEQFLKDLSAYLKKGIRVRVETDQPADKHKK